jgi:hypothetical protein
MKRYAFFALLAVGACQIVSGEVDREFVTEEPDPIDEVCPDPVASCGDCGSDACCVEDCGQECTCRSGCTCVYTCPSPPCALHCESSGGCLLMCGDAEPDTPQCRMEECDNARVCPDGSTVACGTECPPT